MKYIRKISEAKEKPVTKVMWDKKMSDDQKETALLSVFEDPDDVDRWLNAKYDDLPPQASHMYSEKLEEYPLAKEPFHGSPVIGKEIGETEDQEAADEIQKKKEEEEDEEAEWMAATDAAQSAGPPDQGGFAKAIGKQMKAYMENVSSFKEFNEIEEGKCPDSGCTKKVGKKWRVISNKTGKLWPQHYDTEKDAKDAIAAYHS